MGFTRPLLSLATLPLPSVPGELQTPEVLEEFVYRCRCGCPTVETVARAAEQMHLTAKKQGRLQQEEMDCHENFKTYCLLPDFWPSSD